MVVYRMHNANEQSQVEINITDTMGHIEQIAAITSLADLDTIVKKANKFKYMSPKTLRRLMRKANAKARELA
jgi:hypothetical protein